MATHQALLQSSETGWRMHKPSINRDPQTPKSGEVGVGPRDPGIVTAGTIQLTKTSPLLSGRGK
eukprot:6476437-Pyramimonas_sp.AAC.1